MDKREEAPDYLIRFARYSDLGRVNSIMDRMESQIDDTTIFVSDDEDFIRNHIKDEGFIVVAGHSNKVVAFLIVRYLLRTRTISDGILTWMRMIS